MANKRHKPEEIVQKLRQVDVLVGQGVQRVDAIPGREVRSAASQYQWLDAGALDQDAIQHPAFVKYWHQADPARFDLA